MQQNHYPKAHGQQDADKDKRVPVVPGDDSSAQVEEPVVAVENPVVNEPDTEIPVKQDANPTKPITGVVTDCLKLNVRSTPTDSSGKGNVVTTIECLTEVVIDMEGSTDRFYKICTASGIEGFCMRQYIAVRPQ